MYVEVDFVTRKCMSCLQSLPMSFVANLLFYWPYVWLVFSHFPTDRFYMNRISIRMLITQHCKYMLQACFLSLSLKKWLYVFKELLFWYNWQSKISFNVFMKNFDFDFNVYCYNSNCWNMLLFLKEF